jgi:hypothetical protein
LFSTSSSNVRIPATGRFSKFHESYTGLKIISGDGVLVDILISGGVTRFSERTGVVDGKPTTTYFALERKVAWLPTSDTDPNEGVLYVTKYTTHVIEVAFDPTKQKDQYSVTSYETEIVEFEPLTSRMPKRFTRLAVA